MEKGGKAWGSEVKQEKLSSSDKNQVHKVFIELKNIIMKIDL